MSSKRGGVLICLLVLLCCCDVTSVFRQIPETPRFLSAVHNFGSVFLSEDVAVCDLAVVAANLPFFGVWVQEDVENPQGFAVASAQNVVHLQRFWYDGTGRSDWNLSTGLPIATPDYRLSDKGGTLSHVGNGKGVLTTSLQVQANVNPRTFGVNDGLSAQLGSVGMFPSMFNQLLGLLTGSPDLCKLFLVCPRLTLNGFEGADCDDNAYDPGNEQPDVGQIFRRKQTTEIALRLILGPILLCTGCLLIYRIELTGVGWRHRLRFWGVCCLGTTFIGSGLGAFFLPVYWQDERERHHNEPSCHGVKSVTQKYLLTFNNYCNTVMPYREAAMANVLSTEKQVTVISALAEGSSIRSIERMTGIHRDTVMRLGVRVGKGCQMLLDSKMQDLGCRYLQFDEVWGFIGKKERHLRVDDDPEMGDVWTFCAIDAETKVVPSFMVGKRNHETANAFVQDVASRMRNRVQISTDALSAYVQAVENSFGADVDYGQIVKVYVHDDAQHPERKYSAPAFASALRRPITGDPEMELVSTSHVERLNATTRLHVKRLSRLTLAFSKKLENFKAAVALHFAYYNLVKRHNTLRCTPAMAAGVERDFWTVADLVKAVA